MKRIAKIHNWILLIGLVILLSSVKTEAYSPRLSLPSNARTSIKEYSVDISLGRGNYNPYVLFDTGNCTWYAFGRAWEILGYYPEKLVFSGDANVWFGENKVNYDNGRGGFPYTTDRNEPALGAIAVWRDKTKTDGSGGHVAVVESITDNGNGTKTIVTSESGWQSYYFSTKERSTAGTGLGWPDSRWEFLGYIYLIDASIPKITQAKSIDGNGLYFEWTKPNDAYQVFIELLDSSGTQISSVWTGYEGWTYLDLRYGETYTFKICSVYQDGSSSPKNSYSIKVDLPTPTITKAECINGNDLYFEWIKPKSAYQCFVELYDATGKQISHFWTGYEGWTFQNLDLGTYTLYICSQTEDGKSSEKVSSTLEVRLLPPTITKAECVNGNDLQFEWSIPKNAYQCFVELYDVTGKQVSHFWTGYEGWTFQNLDFGTYILYICSQTEDGKSSEKVSHTIEVGLVPPTITKAECVNGNDLHFEWSIPKNAYQCFVELYDETGKKVSYFWTGYEGWTFQNLDCGTYTLYICSVTEDGKSSEKVSRTIKKSVDLGTDFYAYIVNNNTSISSWKHIGTTVSSDNVELIEINGYSSEIWFFEHQSDSTYKITNARNGKVLGVDSTGKVGANVLTYGNNNSNTQKWYITGSSPNYRILPACLDAGALNVSGNTGAIGSNVIVGESNGSGNQNFEIWKVDLQPTTLTCSQESLEVQEVSFSWDKKAYADYYDLHIYRDKLYSEEYYPYLECKKESLTVSLPGGHYFAYIDSCNSLVTANSKVIEFDVCHEEIVDEKIEPTCTELGYTEGSHCEICGEILVEQKEIPATGHKEVVDKKQDATCIEIGYTEGSHCGVCGEVLVEQKEIPVSGHTEVIDEKIEATCVEKGYMEGSHCGVCGEVLVEQKEIPATGHTEVVDRKQNATCTENGYTEGSHCKICGEILVEQKEIPAAGHKEVVDEKIEATCTEAGYTEGSHCEVCGEVLVEQEEITATGHKEVVDKKQDATCTEVGYTEGSHCEVCGEVLVERKEIPATDHTEVVDRKQNATCTESGYTEGSHCKVCGEVLVEQKEIPATGHTEVVDRKQNATCTEPGYTEGSHCKICGEILVEQKEIPAAGHTEVVDRKQVATCTEVGYTEGSHCKVCREILVEQEEIPAVGHEFVKGLCQRCGEYEVTDAPYICISNEYVEALLPPIENVFEQGFLYIADSDQRELNLATLGRLRITFNETEEGRYQLGISDISSGIVKAYIIYTDGNGEEQVAYSAPIILKK